jgi:uncharacterized protein YjbJ (UPF0337 family)
MSDADDRKEHKAADHKAEELRGRLKEGVGKATDDEALKRQGENEQTASKVKQAGDKLKDAAKQTKDRVTKDDK